MIAERQESSRQYAQVLLRVLGLPETPSQNGGKLYHFLFQPTFHPYCCVTIDEDAEGDHALCALHILEEGTFDLLNAIWHGQLTDEMLTPHRNRNSLVVAPSSGYKDIEALFEAASLFELSDPAADSRYRDGISVTCYRQGQDGERYFEVTNASYAESAAQRQLLTRVLELACLYFYGSVDERYLDELGRYLADYRLKYGKA